MTARADEPGKTAVINNTAQRTLQRCYETPLLNGRADVGLTPPMPVPADLAALLPR